MRDPFFTQSQCSRCGGSLAGGRIQSMFDDACICLACKDAERKHPDYRKAADAELAEVRKGNMNFAGIGYPGKKGGNR